MREDKMVTVGLTHFLVISTLLFSMGLYAIITRKNAVMVLMGVELILNSANINFIAFSRFGNFGYNGQLIALFVIVLAAAEAAIALAIVLNIYKNLSTVNVDEVDNLKD
ncbi:MAG: NADH-quinone oxidoreductase subunit NuoK [Ignavibacterium sp.]